MTALFGPQNANAALQLPPGTASQRYGAAQTWVKDCSAPGLNDGTVLDAAFYNRIIGNLDYLCSVANVTGSPGDMSVLYRAVIASVAEGAADAVDTIAELGRAIKNDPNFGDTILGQLTYRLRFDASQTLTPTQKGQAVYNLGLAPVAVSGNYGDLSNTPTIGTAANNLVQLNGSAKLPAVDGSNLTNVTVAWANVSGRPTIGTAANNVVQLDGSAKLPAVDGSQLINVPATVNLGAQGQCVLTTSGGNLLLKPFQGNALTVNGVSCTVPDAGVSLAPTGLTASTLYYIYATQTGGVITALEASTTGHVTDTTAGNKGVEIKSGASTRTLVGMAYVTAGPVWFLVRTWFNRKTQMINSQSPANTALPVGPSVEITTTLRTNFLTWADEAIHMFVSCIFYTSNIATVTFDIGVDGTFGYRSIGLSGDGSGRTAHAPLFFVRQMTEGFHWVSIAGSITTGSGALHNSSHYTLTVAPRD